MQLTYEKLLEFDLLTEKNFLWQNNITSLNQYIQLSQEIESVDRFIQDSPSFPGSTKEIIRSELRSVVGSTLAIEGIFLNPDEIEGSFDKAKQSRTLLRKEQEAENSRQVYSFITEVVKNSEGKFAFSEHVIRQIHTCFTRGLNYPGNRPGEYRDFSVTFGSPRKSSLCRTRSEIETVMLHYINWLNDSDKGILPGGILPKAILAHYYLAEIHPFCDGNGRTARAVEALVLFNSGINGYSFWSLANFWSANRNEYINALGSIRETCDPLDFILWGMQGYLDEITRIKELTLKKVKQLMLMDYAKYLLENKANQKIKFNRRLLIVLSLLVAGPPRQFQGFLSSPEMTALYSSVTNTTRWRDMRKLVNLKFIRLYEEDKEKYVEPNFELLEDLRHTVL